jgi:C_GCAxxG_C_C family probable redox protein
VLSTYGERFGLDREMGLRVAGAFGGGMGRMGEMCGAVTGAFMAIGLKHGKRKADDDEAREKTYELVNAFAARFKSRNNSLVCRELLGHDLSTEQGRDAVAEKNLFLTLCPKFVDDAGEILEELI